MTKGEESRGFCQGNKECISCEIKGRLMCSFQSKDLLIFLIGILVAVVPGILGVFLAGYGGFLLLWLAYTVFFLQIWENRILCSHCPNYASEGRTLRCHANLGLLKLWRYRPDPMSREEQFQFIFGILIFIGFPFPFLLLGSQWLFLILTTIGVIILVVLLVGKLCVKCLNFSCPLNRVPKEVIDTFLLQNPEMRKAWEAKGYRATAESARKSD